MSDVEKSKQSFVRKGFKKLDIPVSRNHPDYWKYYRRIRGEQLKNNHDKYLIENREKRNEQWRNWASKNKEKRNALNAFARTEKLKRFPAWADKEAIMKFYANCPKGYHIDHIIPLRGKTVSGLHVLNNLQYLPAKENMAKGNKFLTDE